ncbi:phage holin family protein [Streptomyces albogriseolus]|uniref:phage holin family protein n=1 Tax=Streptomyces albogriseolus TaxID=1887 RepID=UPI003CFB9A0C
MQRLEHMQHLDKHLVDELALVARESVRAELREQTRGQRRKAALYAGSGAAALYAGAAVALAVGLALDLVLPGWAAALITAALLTAVAFALRTAARPAAPAAPTATGATNAPGSAPVPPVPSAPPTVGTDRLPGQRD